jgi:L-alanine-DL-glutamate epimerase-like enolase superfamily enzyme
VGPHTHRDQPPAPSDFGQVTTFDAAILRIETDDGIVGWGEGKNAAGSAGTYGALVTC